MAKSEAEEARAPDALAVRELDRAGLLPGLLGAAEDHAGDPDAARAAVAELLASPRPGDGGYCRPAALIDQFGLGAGGRFGHGAGLRSRNSVHDFPSTLAWESSWITHG